MLQENRIITQSPAKSRQRAEQVSILAESKQPMRAKGNLEQRPY
jgi:hypothetical protein